MIKVSHRPRTLPIAVAVAPEVAAEVAALIDLGVRAMRADGRGPSRAVEDVQLALTRLAATHRGAVGDAGSSRVEWVTSAHAAELIGISRSAVAARVRSGSLRSRREGAAVLVDRYQVDELAALHAQRRTDGAA